VSVLIVGAVRREEATVKSRRAQLLVRRASDVGCHSRGIAVQGQRGEPSRLLPSAPAASASATCGAIHILDLWKGGRWPSRVASPE
jgi:hypothetical protein